MVISMCYVIAPFSRRRSHLPFLSFPRAYSAEAAAPAAKAGKRESSSFSMPWTPAHPGVTRVVGGIFRFTSVRAEY